MEEELKTGRQESAPGAPDLAGVLASCMHLPKKDWMQYHSDRTSMIFIHQKKEYNLKPNRKTERRNHARYNCSPGKPDGGKPHCDKLNDNQ